MVVDRRLQPYWEKVMLLNRTKDPSWRMMLEVLAATTEGPASRAAQRFLDAG